MLQLVRPVIYYDHITSLILRRYMMYTTFRNNNLMKLKAIII